jgi:hypothetical protein
MPLAEIEVHERQFRLASAHVHVQDGVYDPPDARQSRGVQRTRLRRYLERAYDHPPRLGLQPEGKYLE